VSATRFNVLLTEDRDHATEHWTRQLPRLLEPMGIAAHVARTAPEAIELAERIQMHAAVLDLATPMAARQESGSGGFGGRDRFWLVEVFQRMPGRPPIVVLRPPAWSSREAQRLLERAVQRDVFSVVDKPVELELLLDVFRRLVEQRYGGSWPGG